MLLKSVRILYSRQLKNEPKKNKKQKTWGSYERVGKERTAAGKR